jgi:hypothetical protein
MSNNASQLGNNKKRKRKVKFSRPEMDNAEVRTYSPGPMQKKILLPNWEHHEVVALIKAKWNEQQKKRATNNREDMVSAPDQWLAISQKVLATIGGVYDWIGQACCNK